MGIPKSKQSEIFREFERLPAAIGMAPGLGLGLSIVQRLGRVLRHDIRIRSKPGRGSVFSILVPRAPDPQIARRHASESVPAGQRSLEGLSIVAIDNEPTILAGMEALLAGWGCQIVTGPDAASVGATLRTRGIVPDVIIADYHLDHGDGITAIAVLRARYGPCQAVLVTADQSPHVAGFGPSRKRAPVEQAAETGDPPRSSFTMAPPEDGPEPGLIAFRAAP